MNREETFSEVISSFIDTYRKVYNKEPDEKELKKFERWANTITGKRNQCGMAGLENLLKGIPEVDE